MKGLKPIESVILTIRGTKVLIDADLAAVYGVETRALNQAVKRNAVRFPVDFLFQLTAEEKLEVITNCDHLAPLRFGKSLPFAFTEHGALMAATVLSTPQAVAMSVYVVRAFIQMREQLAANREILKRLTEIDKTLHYSWFSIALIITLSLVGEFQSLNSEWGEGVIWATAIVTALFFFDGAGDNFVGGGRQEANQSATVSKHSQL